MPVDKFKKKGLAFSEFSVENNNPFENKDFDQKEESQIYTKKLQFKIIEFQI